MNGKKYGAKRAAIVKLLFEWDENKARSNLKKASGQFR
jgi:hypothetical protein